ncbi:PAS domain-containing protein [Halovenus halobia]|uniref:PAS domain-containing protein n=1 Tax=Halovenus halobia TaxID=3396622 RepID=UPI003F5590C1
MSGNIRVLHVDDDPNLADVASTVLERESEELTVETATHPDEGLDQLGSKPFDCVVSDYDMPDTNGIQFLEAVRENHPDLPFILFTGKGSEEIASEAISAGVTDYLQKESGIDQYAVLANRIQNAADARESEQMLEERTRRLETLISTLPGIVYRSKNQPDWPMEAVEGEVEELTGYTAEELESGSVVWGEDVLHPEERERMWAAVQEGLARDGTFEVTYQIQTRDGAVRWMWERGRGIYDNGDLEALEGFITDITERKRWAERLDAYIDNTSDILGIVSEDGTFADLSPSSEHVLGYTPEELVGDSVFEYVHPADREWVGSEFADLVETGTRKRIEYRFQDADGSYLWLESVASDRTESALSGYVVTTRDITDRKEREHKLLTQNEKLDAFTGFVSHDLRNALNVATLRLDLATQDVESPHLDNVADSLDRMEQLIDDLLVFADQGTAVGDTEAVDLAELAPEPWANLDTAGATLELAFDDSPTIQADPSRVKSLLENLYHNAVEHGDTDTTVTVGTLDPDGFYVEDDGVGLAVEERDRVFEAGYTTKDDGTGLGLAIVEQVATEHGWDIDVTESEAGGARFEITGVGLLD